VGDDASLRSKLVPALRPDFEVLEGENYKTAYKLLQESELDVLLLGLPIASGGVRECSARQVHYNQTAILGQVQRNSAPMFTVMQILTFIKNDLTRSNLDDGAYPFFWPSKAG
jgi:hypothetical protein